MHAYVLLALIFVLSTVSVNSAFAQTSCTNTVTIGALIPQTGSLAGIIGDHATYAMGQAESDFNEYLAAQNEDWCLSVNIQNTNSEADTALASAQTLIADGIQFIAGPARSDGVDAIKMHLEASTTPIALSLISYGSTAPELAIAGDEIFRLVPSDEKHGPVIANIMHIAGKDVVIPVFVDESFGRGLAQSTVDRFEELGHTSIYQAASGPITSYVNGSGVLSYSDCTDNNGDAPGNDNPTCNDQFPALVSDLNDIVVEQIRQVGADNIFVLYVGFHSPEFVSEAAKYPALRLVQWVGSDADVLKGELVSDEVTRDFLTDTNFRTCTFEFDSGTARFESLESRLASEFPDAIPLKYVYSAYDSIWVIGLAIETAGGASYAYDDVDIQMTTNDYNDGTLGDITLDEFGDLDSSDFGVFGIEDGAWERIGLHDVAGNFRASYVDTTNIINIGAVLDLQNAPLFDDDFAVIMALSAQDFDEENSEINLITVNASNGVLPALNEAYYGVYDEFYHDALLKVINDTIRDHHDSMDTENPFGSMPNAVGEWTSLPEVGGDVLYVFVVNSEGVTVEHGTNPNLHGESANDLVFNSDREISTVHDLLAMDGGPAYVWWQYEFPADVLKRSILFYHEDSGLIVGAGYYPPVGDAGHQPDLIAVIDDAIAKYDANPATDKFAGITFDRQVQLFSPFVFNFTDTSAPQIALHTFDESQVGPIPDDVLDSITGGSTSVGDYVSSLRSSDGAWVELQAINPSNGLHQTQRAWLVAHDTDDIVFAAGYFVIPPLQYYAGPTTSPALSEAIRSTEATDSTEATESFVSSTGSILVSPTSSATSLALPDDGVYRLAPPITNDNSTLSEILEQDGRTSVIVAHIDNVWGQDWADLFNMGERAHAFAADADFSSLATDLESSVTSLGVDDSDIAIMFVGSPQNYIDLANAIGASSVLRGVAWYGTDNLVNDDAIIDDDGASGLAGGTMLTAVSFAVEPNAKSIELRNSLESMGIDFNGFSNSAYDSVSLLGGLASSNSHEQVRAHLEDTTNTYDGALGEYTLDANGDLASPIVFHTSRVASDGSSWIDLCGVSLEHMSIDFGDADDFSLLTAVMQQNVTNSGVRPIQGLQIYPTASFTSAASDPLTEVDIGGTWLQVNEIRDIAVNLAPEESLDVSFRMNFEHITELSDADVAMSHDISYRAMCG